MFLPRAILSKLRQHISQADQALHLRLLAGLARYAMSRTVPTPSGSRQISDDKDSGVVSCVCFCPPQPRQRPRDQ